ncbi:MAG: hypothetical protein OQK78_07295 [Gammaproteobacteria bacterium]|nr:hypothetical protein [Gammaproteobacteria bacterium]
MDLSTLFGDPVALFSTLAVVGSLVVIGVLVVRVLKLINTTKSED